MTQPKTIGTIIKVRTLAIVDAIVAALLLESWCYLPRLFGVETQAMPSKILILISMLLLIALSYLALFIFKFNVVNTALLHIQPDFYEQREFGKWFDYYAKKEEKHKNS